MYKTIVISFCFLVVQGFSQGITKVPDSLLSKSYKVLVTNYELQTKNKELAQLYALALLTKAKADQDVIKQADGYYKLAKVVEQSKAITYADSVISLTKDINDYTYPVEAFLFKARILGLTGKYRQAMQELANANHYANINNNSDQQYRIKYYIALLKNNLGEFQETLAIFKSIKKYYKVKYEVNPEEFSFDYLTALYGLGNAYNDNKKFDSAYYENKNAIRLSLKTKDSTLYKNLLLSSGVTHYLRKEYQSGLDSIFKFKNLFPNKSQLGSIYITSADLYLGKIY